MTTPATPPPHDEISLRDLYLVVRRNLLAIMAAAAIAALVVGVATSTRPASFEAEATTAVARAPISVQQEVGLAFRPELDVTYDTYQTLAYSRGVLEQVAERVPDAGGTLPGSRDTFTLERLAGSANQPSSLLAVAHRVRSGDAGIAAELATVWASVTIETVRTLLNENLDAIERITSDGVLGAGERLAAADAALREVREAQDVQSDPQWLARLQGRLASLDVLADDVARAIRAREAEAASLRERTSAGGDELVVLTDSPDVGLSLVGALWATEARLAALHAEGEAIGEQRDALRLEIAESAPSVARYQADLVRRSRELAQAQRAFDALADIEPTVAYVAQLAPTGARLLSEAAVPSHPEPQRAVLASVIAAVIAGFVSVVFVLLREAVRDPSVSIEERMGGSARGRRIT